MLGDDQHMRKVGEVGVRQREGGGLGKAERVDFVAVGVGGQRDGRLEIRIERSAKDGTVG